MTNLVLGAGGAAEDYTIDQSLRCNSPDSGYLSRTVGTPTSTMIGTLSFWVKKGLNGTEIRPFGNYTDEPNRFYFSWASGNYLELVQRTSGSVTIDLATDGGPLYRDLSAWMHVVFAVDATQGTDTNRAKLYINGDQVTDFNSPTYPTQDVAQPIFDGSNMLVAAGYSGSAPASKYFDGYIAEFYYIDGQALTPSSFGETDSTTNQWKPIDASGLTFGTNGFYQKYAATTLANSFTDSSSSAHTITENGDVANTRAQLYTVESFTTAETTSWTAPAGVTEVECLVVAGGGGGGHDAGGGGGAGGYRTATLSVTPSSSYTVTVGDGGVAGTSAARNTAMDGEDSVFSSITSTGGGAGANIQMNWPTTGYSFGAPGGSGGGGGGYVTGVGGDDGGSGNEGSYDPVEGYDGGPNRVNTTIASGGGGGGSSSAGQTAQSGSDASGGSGTSNSISGSAVTYAAGGIGCTDNSGAGTVGAANTGNGGGGGGADPSSNNGYAGGSGIVILKYILPKPGDSSIVFDGTGDYLTVANSSDFHFGTGDYTIEFWVYQNASGGMVMGDDAAFQFYIVSGALGYFSGTSSGVYDIVDDASFFGTLSNNTWQHVAVVRDGTTITGYVAGTAVTTETGVSGTTQAFTSVVGIGAHGAGAYVWSGGYLDEIRISDSARYTSSFTPSTTAFTSDSNTMKMIFP